MWRIRWRLPRWPNHQSPWLSLDYDRRPHLDERDYLHFLLRKMPIPVLKSLIR